jgi:small subunit ribosomal protein S6
VSRDYELAFILNPEVSEEETRSILDRVEQIVANYGGQIVKVNQWGRRRLAYPIERHRDGLYVFIDMILTPETVFELERMLKVSEVVLRHMVKKRDPKAIQKEREERAEREARTATTAAAPATEAQQPEEPVAAPVEAPVEEIPVLSEAEMEDVPPAIEESVEA